MKLRSLSLGVLVVLLAGTPAAAEAVKGAAAYRAWLLQERQLVSQAGALAVAPGKLKAAKKLALKPEAGLAPEDTAWLADDCDAVLRAKPRARQALLRNLLTRIDAYDEALTAGRPHREDPAFAKRDLRSILARPEFDCAPPPPIGGKN